MEIKFLNKNFKGIFISTSKKSIYVYLHFPTFTVRVFTWGIDWYCTKGFNKMHKLNLKYGH